MAPWPQMARVEMRGMYDKQGEPLLGAAPPPPGPPGVKPGWCEHVPQENLRYVPDCSSKEQSLW